MTDHRDPAETLAASWEANATAWTRAVREGWIPSRAAATDAAILEAVAAAAPERLLDIGCGEGWLCRAVRERLPLCAPMGVDAIPTLIDAARASDPLGAYEVTSQEAMAAGDWRPPLPVDLAVFNYALFGESLTPLLAAVRAMLAPGGLILVQTLHPWATLAEGPYQDGWRTEDFSAFTEGDWTPMPWYARTLEGWVSEAAQAGLVLSGLREPTSGDPPRPLSLVMTFRAA